MTTSKTDKQLSDDIIQVLTMLEKRVRDAEKAGLEVSINTFSTGYTAKIYRRTDTIIAEHPKKKGK